MISLLEDEDDNYLPVIKNEQKCVVKNEDGTLKEEVDPIRNIKNGIVKLCGPENTIVFVDDGNYRFIIFPTTLQLTSGNIGRGEEDIYILSLDYEGDEEYMLEVEQDDMEE